MPAGRAGGLFVLIIDTPEPARALAIGGLLRQERQEMTRQCELTGKLPLSGQNRSHAENKSKRKFNTNLCNVTLMSDTLGQKYRLRVSAHALKTVEHRGGLDAFLMKAKDAELSGRVLKIKRDVKKARKTEGEEVAA